jgi:DNA-nicking Smr family endonuclease
VKKISTLADLKQMKSALAAAEKERAALQAQRALAAKQERAAQDLFSRAVGKITPLQKTGHAHPPKAQPEPVALQQQRDEQAVLQASISDDFDVETLLETDEALSFRRAGIGPDVVRKLRKGEWSVQAHLDLHGLRKDEAREALAAFVREAVAHGLRCVRVVHGKGLGSPGKAPVLKSKVQSWLVQKSEVMAFVQARPAEGGAGALLVLLKSG